MIVETILRRFISGFCRRPKFEMSQIESVSNFWDYSGYLMALPAKKRADVLNGI
jgi:hypothetical protein